MIFDQRDYYVVPAKNVGTIQPAVKKVYPTQTTSLAKNNTTTNKDSVVEGKDRRVCCREKTMKA